MLKIILVSSVIPTALWVRIILVSAVIPAALWVRIILVSAVIPAALWVKIILVLAVIPAALWGKDHFCFSCNSCCIVNCMKTEIAQRTNKTDINHVPCLINRNVSFFHPLYSLFHFVRPTCLVQARTGLLQAVLSGLTGHMINGSFNTIQ